MPSTPTSRTRHALSPAERWNQLRKAKAPPIRIALPPTSNRLATFRCFSILLIPLIILFFLFTASPKSLLFFPSASDSRLNSHLSYSRSLPNNLANENIVTNFTTPSTVLLTSESPAGPAQANEFVTVYRPFLFVEEKLKKVDKLERPLVIPATLRGDPANLMRKRTTFCTSFDGTVTHTSSKCLAHIRGLNVIDSSLSHNSIMRNAPRAAVAEGISCANKSVVILPLAYQDSDVFHLLPRLLMAYTVIQRSIHTPPWLQVPRVRVVVIVVKDIRVFQLLRPGAGTLHSSLATALLAHDNVHVAVVQSVRELSASCFSAGLIVGSLFNRLSLPDTVLGSSGGYDGKASKEPPLSSDLLALRDHALPKELSGLKMRNKLLYVVDEPEGGSGLTALADSALQDGLRRISRREGIHLVTLDISAQRLSLKEHAAKFADASVIVGVHGPALAMAVFAPNGAGLIEIRPRRFDDPTTDLYESITSAGVDYVKVDIGSSADKTIQHRLSDAERETILHFVADRVHAGKQRSASLVEDIVIT